MKKNDQIIMGVDEVGRGCLAGPVCAAAVILPTDSEHREWISQIRDSKKISEKKREKLAEFILKHSLWYIEESWPEQIDRENILNATLDAMRRAVVAVSFRVKPDIVLVDGNKCIPGIDLPQECIISGDDAIKAIGAASIIAKVTRDYKMKVLHSSHPEYDFLNNKGYGTKKHLAALRDYGPCPLHRRSFRPVSEWEQSDV